MKAFLMHRERDFESEVAMPWNERSLVQDLELNILLDAMADGDEYLLDVARKALLSGFRNDADAILYRHGAMKDCLKNPGVVRGLYNSVVEFLTMTKKHWWGMSSLYPSSMLYSSIGLLESSLGTFRKLRAVAEGQGGSFESEAFTALFASLRKELADDYLETIQRHLAGLRFRKGVLLSAELGEYNEGTNYVLRRPSRKDVNWLQRILGKGPRAYSFRLAERDTAGPRILSDMQHLATSRVAIALARSSDHILSFFRMLRMELAFYVGCLNLHDRLAARGQRICFPVPVPAGQRKRHFTGLYDVSLSLRLEGKVVSNAGGTEGKNLWVITGANQGGKSSFLRSIGQAQLMMQCGMFVGADSLEAELCPSLSTHYKREEDVAMKSGKFDEEIARISEIVDHLVPDSIVLFNESFAATNEREGSEIAGQIVRALLEMRVKMFYVTHLFEFARGFFDEKREDCTFWRAERESDGTRTFRILEGEPLETSYGEDLYRQIFDADQHFENVESKNAKLSVVPQTVGGDGLRSRDSRGDSNDG